MDRRLLRYYEQELLHLREMGKEFAQEFPKIAGRLTLDQLPCPDPYVERLLEGFAFLTARVQLKLDAQFPRVTQNLLETVYPHYLAPLPSMTLLQLDPDIAGGDVNAGFKIPRLTQVQSVIGRGETTACTYRTAHDVTLWPIAIKEARYYTRDLGALDIKDLSNVKAGVRIRLSIPLAGLNFDKLPLDRLTFHLAGTPEVQGQLYEQIFAQAHRVILQPVTKPLKWAHIQPETAINRIGFSDTEALLPYGPRSFQGYRLLQEYFAFPQRFMFFELTNLAPALKKCQSQEIDIILLFRQPDLRLENVVNQSNFLLHCTPAVNLFPKRCNRVPISDRFHEFPVIPDITRPRDFEVYQVTSVVGTGARAEEQRPFRPFYSASDFDGGVDAYYSIYRQPRVPSERERRLGGRSQYAGSEVFISLVDAKSAPFSADLKQLAIEAFCTNRDLALFVSLGKGNTDFVHESGPPIRSIRSIGAPTAPRPSFAEGDMAWRLVSHLSLNYISLMDSRDGQGAEALRSLLKLYAGTTDASTGKQIAALKSISSAPIHRRLIDQGPICFVRGLELTLTIEEAAFEGCGAFLFGAILEEFLARYVSLNSFTETIVTTPERGQIMRWKPRTGRRQIL